MFMLEFPERYENWFSDIELSADLGYIGLKKDYKNFLKLHIPQKKKTGQKHLTQEQKEHNKNVSKRRIFVENAIAGFKRFYILVNRFRNKIRNFDDKVIEIATSLNNLNIKFNT